MPKLCEQDLCKIRDALDKDSLGQALNAAKNVLTELGCYRNGRNQSELCEYDLCRMRDALNKDNLVDAIGATSDVLVSLGYNSVNAIAVIPCFDEAQSISDVVFKVNQFVGISIVVDDNSHNGTAGIAEKSGAYLVRRFQERGVGANTKAGIDRALIMGCDAVVTLDGDGQHNPDEMWKLLLPIERGEADVVVGSRFIGEHNCIPSYRRFGIKVITWLYNLGSKNRLSDVQCCYRAFKREVLESMAIEESGFSFSTEMLVKARALGFRIVEVPVSVLYHRQFSKNSSLNPISHGLSVALGTIKTRIKVDLLPRLKKGFTKLR